ncbi:MAG: pitrilysin family protein [Candidatus Erginobacter occultus]|nr:pitrilysin family protein [Candidatus Erginobacter occultus]
MKISGIHSSRLFTGRALRHLPAAVPVLLFLLLAPAALALPETAGLPRAERVLDNGLEVVAAPDSSNPVVALQLWVKAGSVHEAPLLGSGLSHFLEHMAFKGPAGELKGAIPREVERLGGTVNAYTSFDRTVYHFTLPADRWREALPLLKDLVFEMDFQPAEVESEREVILKEINMNRDEPGRRLQHLLWRTAYRAHPYRFPVIGYREVFRRVSREELLEYYRKWYVPNNMILIGAGDLSGEEFIPAAEEVFGAIPPGPYPVAEIPAEPAQVGGREAVEEMDVAQTRIAFAFHIPSIHSPDLFALDVLALLAGEGKTSVLYRDLREERELVYSIGAYSYTPLFPGVFVVQARAEPEKIPAVREAVREVLDGFKAGEVSKVDLTKARSRVTAGYLESLTTAEGRAGVLGHNLRTAGSADFDQTYLAGIAAVTPEDIRRVARRYLTEDNLTVVRIEPAAAVDPGLPDPAPGEIPVEKTVLDNGLTVLLGPDRRLPLVSIRMVFTGGVLGEEPDQSGVSQLTARLLLQGTRNRTAREIAGEIEDYGGSISAYSARNGLGLSLDLLSTRTVSGLEVLSDIVANADFPPGELEKERAALLAAIAAEEDDPRSLAGRLLREELFGEHPYRFSTLGTAETVAGLTGEEIAGFRDRFLTGSNGVLAVFGDIDPEEILPVIRDLFSTLPEGERVEPAGTAPPPPAGIRKEVRKKEAITQSVVFQGFSGVTVGDPDRYALEFLSSVFSGLSAPLFARVRIEGGLAYYVGAYQILGLDPGAFVFYAGTVPGKEAPVLEAFREEMERARKGEFPPEELERVRNRLLGEFRFGRQTSGQKAFPRLLTSFTVSVTTTGGFTGSGSAP